MTIYTTLPGHIVDYDGETATVRPAQDMMLANGQPLKPPQIVRVPICWPTADNAQAIVSLPLKPGDNVLLYFAMRSLENWLSGSDQAPDDPRQFDMSDAFAAPILRPGIRNADTENVSIEYGVGSIKIAPNGDVTVQTPNITVNAMNSATVNTSDATVNTDTLEVNATDTTYNSPVTVNGLLTFTAGMTGSGGSGMSMSGDIAVSGGDVTVDGISAKHHTHPGDSGGTTGEPQ